MKQPLLIPVLRGDEERYQNVERYELFYKGTPLWVEEGYVCDGASVWRPVWFFMPPDGLHRPASLLHDRFYNSQGKHCGLNLTRMSCDIMFYDLMIEAGVSRWRALIAYRMVRRFGGLAWRSIDPVIIEPVRNSHVSRSKKSTFFFRHIYETAIL